MPLRAPIRHNGAGSPVISPHEAHRRLVADVQELGRQLRALDGRGPWSTGERIAGALLADEVAWLPDGYTLAAAIDRLGPTWLAAVLEAGTGNVRQIGVRTAGADGAREDLVDIIIAIARAMTANDGCGPWSTGERIAGALLAGVPAWLPDYTVVEAIDRIQGDWLAAVIEADRLGWQDGA